MRNSIVYIDIYNTCVCVCTQTENTILLADGASTNKYSIKLHSYGL